MTLHARNCGMLARQREARQFMVEQHLVLPAVDVVTTTAIRSQPGFVGIIIGMAARTFGWRQFHMGGLFVARFTQDGFMCSLERKACHRIVVERSDLPVFAIVAFRTIRAVATFVRIVLFVAADASHRRRFDSVVNAVASRAGGRHMRSHQFEPRILIVVEVDRLPGGRRMALGAVGSP